MMTLYTLHGFLTRRLFRLPESNQMAEMMTRFLNPMFIQPGHPRGVSDFGTWVDAASKCWQGPKIQLNIHKPQELVNKASSSPPYHGVKPGKPFWPYTWCLFGSGVSVLYVNLQLEFPVYSSVTFYLFPCNFVITNTVKLCVTRQTHLYYSKSEQREKHRTFVSSEASHQKKIILRNRMFCTKR